MFCPINSSNVEEREYTSVGWWCGMIGVYDDEGVEAQECRVLALLFMAEMVEQGDIE